MAADASAVASSYFAALARRDLDAAACEAFSDSLGVARQLGSLPKLAQLDPGGTRPGHGEPITGDVRAQLERAAAG